MARGEATGAPVFLGWDGPGWSAALPESRPAPRSALDAAAAWLLRRFGPDLSGVVVAVPGGRAGRRLAELLVERAGLARGGAAMGLWPPHIMTAGKLTDRLLRVERPVASRLVRTLTWQQALRESDPRALVRLVAAPPEPHDAATWLALASELRTLHRELGAERLDFVQVADVVARTLPGDVGAGEAARWTALASVQAGYRRRLAAMECGDPNDLRRAAIEAGRVDPTARVVLVGVVEMSGLLRAAVEALGERVEPLVFAPPELAAEFDAHGCVRAERWAAARVPLSPAAWSVVDRPADQADAVVDTLSRWQARHPLDSVTLGVPDAEVVPYLRARLAEHGVPVREPKDLDLARTPIGRLLAALRGLLERRRFADLAALVRHPQVEAWLTKRLEPRHDAKLSQPRRDVAELLDQYQANHLPDGIPRTWLGREDRAAPLRQVQVALDELLGDLGEPDGPQPLRNWARPIAALLAKLAGDDGVLDRENEQDQILLYTLGIVRKALLELSGLPSGLDETTTVGAADALAALESALAAGDDPPSGHESALELLGWLELPLDEGPLVLTGVNEGRVPEPRGGSALLRDALRRTLGLPGDEQRLARDVYALCAIVASGRELALITGRYTAAGDPLLPSRLLFHCADEAVPARLASWLPKEGRDGTAGGAASTLAARAASPPHRPPLPAAPTPTSMRVTSFRTYLQSPYRFYLECVQGLETFVDARELSPLTFGALVHQVLEDFGKDATLAACTDAATIERFLLRSLEQQVHDGYGSGPLPAVAVQASQLRRRLAGFATWQAARAAAGWRIHAVEWKPEGGALPFDVDGEPMGLRGRIDRIDVHPASGEWAVLDYKTGDGEAKDQDPGRRHRRRDGTWVDLQLPLYRRLVQPLAAERGWTRAPQLGYVVLPRDPSQTGALLVEWDDDDLESAWEAARTVVRHVRAGHFAELGDFPEDEPVLAWIAGRGLLADAGNDDQGNANDEGGDADGGAGGDV